MITRNFNLYLNAGHSVPLVINVNQYDQGEQWVFTLYNSDGIQYTPSSGSIVGIKSDGYIIANAGTVDESGRVVIEETQQMTAAAGKAVFELQIDGDTHGTANFIVLVEKDPSDGGEVSGSDISLLRQALDGGLSQSAVDALLACFQNVAWANANGQTYYDALDNALNAVRSITLNTNTLSFSAIASTQQLTATTVPEGGAVTWASSDTSVATVSSSGLVTTTGYGTATITASSGEVSATCSVAVVQATLVSISAVYTQSGTVYDTDSLDSLKSDLVVTATYDNATTETVPSADYTLSGTLTEGTSTITATYGGKTTTFNVTVTRDPYVYKLPSEFVSDATNYIDTGVELESGNVYSVLLDYTITSLVNSVLYVFGNKIADSTVYSALQVTSKQGNHMWGVGIGYSAGSNLVTAGRRYKAVAIADVDSASWSITLKDVTAGTTNTYTNTYTVPAFTTGKAIFIGNGEGGSSNTGFIGTMHDFKITDRALTSEEITAYLNG